MAKIGRPGLPSDKPQQVWELRKQSKSISEIARTIGSPAGSIFSIFLPFGGYYQAPQRRRGEQGAAVGLLIVNHHRHQLIEQELARPAFANLARL